MAPRSNFTMAGVAEGKKVIGVPTGNESAVERVNALFEGSMSEEMYQVGPESISFQVWLCSLIRIKQFSLQKFGRIDLDLCILWPVSLDQVKYISETS